MPHFHAASGKENPAAHTNDSSQGRPLPRRLERAAAGQSPSVAKALRRASGRTRRPASVTSSLTTWTRGPSIVGSKTASKRTC